MHFANHILNLEAKAFAKSQMPMDRCFFYDCAIIPGFVAGFAATRSSLSKEFLDVLEPESEGEWIPIPLFIIIPSMKTDEWVSHILFSANSLVAKEERNWGLGILSETFGLWYANIKNHCGISQWKSPAMKLHAHFGFF